MAAVSDKDVAEMVRITGASLALLAFAVTILRGLEVGNPAETVLSRALYAMACFLFLGLAAGWVGQTVLEEHNRQQQDIEAAARKAEQQEDVAESGGTSTQTSGKASARASEGSGVRAGASR